MPPLKNEATAMVHQCIRSFVIGSFLKGGITSDRNTRFKLSPPNENATALFSVIVTSYLLTKHSLVFAEAF